MNQDYLMKLGEALYEGYLDEYMAWNKLMKLAQDMGEAPEIPVPMSKLLKMHLQEKLRSIGARPELLGPLLGATTAGLLGIGYLLGDRPIKFPWAPAAGLTALVGGLGALGAYLWRKKLERMQRDPIELMQSMYFV